MKRLLLAAAFFVAPAGVAHAAPPVQMVVRDVVPSSPRALASAAPRFNLVGLHWTGSGTPWFRTRSVAGRWSAWEPGDDDSGRSGEWRLGNPVWTGAADAIQVRLRGRVTHVREYLLWSPPIAAPKRRLQLAGSPVIISRVGWQADESIRRNAPRIAPTLKLAVVHHTATPNGYSCARSASIVRGIEVYHVKGNGWDDIGYNFLVDACGQIFEGRYGGIERNVIGAHSGGFNTGTVGVSMIGNYDRVAPSKAEQNALVKLLAWRLDVGHVDPRAIVPFVSGGNGKFPAGRTVNLRAVSGHRDTYLTSCPGSVAYRLLPSIASRVAQTGLPKLYAPIVSGTVGGPVRFTARLSSALPWTVTVADATGAIVATGRGTGANVAWTWDATYAVVGAAYTWTITAGATVRAAVGVIDGKLATLTLTDLRVTPPVLDGSVVPTATVSYTLSNAATVTAELLDLYDIPATLFVQSKSAGSQSFVLTPTGLADGNYTIRLTVRDALGRQAQATVPVAISHTVLSYTADAKIVSPNGDGRRDTVNLRFFLAQPAAVTLTLDAAFSSLPLLTANLTQGSQTFAFTGVTADGATMPDGAYQAKLTVGTVALSVPLLVDRAPPTMSLVSVSPLRLRVFEPVTVIATINGREIRASKKPGVFTLAKGVTVQTLRAVARDVAGNESVPVTYRRR
ncbi:MAG TPA: N-acetylmuramoyl-L-alanine amidase [Gaiellaceae bacterium]